MDGKNGGKMADLTQKEVRLANERQMFGTTKKEFLDGLHLTDTSDAHEILMLAISILSDVQTKIRHGNGETARQWTNLAKWLIASSMSPIRELPGKLKPDFKLTE